MTDVGESLVLDANAIAGLLEELLGTDATASRRGCRTCGQVHEIGRYRLYRGAGFVLRCPACGDVAARIARSPDRVVVQLSEPPRSRVS